MRKRHPAGLSLVEILAVLGLLALLAVMAAPVVADVLRSRAKDRVLNELASLLEQARNEAMTRQSYAWIGIDSSRNAAGGDELRAVVLALDDGTLTTAGQGSSVLVANARAATRTFRWENVRLAPLSALASLRDLASDAGDSVPLAREPKQGFRLGGAGVSASRFWVVTFTPQGYALLRGIPTILTPYETLIDIGIETTRDGERFARSEEAALVLNGANGRIRTLRR